MTVGDALWLIFQVVLGLGLIAAFILLLLFATRIVLGVVLTLFGIGVVLALYFDAINGWPILSRVAWLIYQLVMSIYTGANAATSGIPEL